MLNDSSFWMNNDQGLLINFNPNNGRTISKEISNEVPIYDIELDDDGIWLASLTGLSKYLFDNDEIVPIIDLDGVRIYDLEKSDNELYVGTSGEGLKILRKSEDNGIELFEYDIGDGLSGNDVFNILVLKDGNLWLGSEPGFTHFFLKENIFSQYLAEDGIPFMRQSGSLIQLNNGTILSSGPRSFSYFTPLSKPQDKYKPKIHIDKIKVHGQEKALPLVQVKLGPKESNISFTYSVIDFCNPVKPRFEYILEGLDRSWTRTKETSDIIYSNLEPGKYNFRIKAANTKGQWSDEYILPIKIKAPLISKWWFWFLMALISFRILLLIHSYRLNQVRKLSLLKSDFDKQIARIEMEALRAQMNPHFLFNSLNSINNVILKKEAKEASNYLTKFSRLIRMILQNSKSQKVTVGDELSAIKLYIEMESLRFGDKFECQFEITPNIDLENTFIAPMLIQPYIENAIWHGLMHKNEKGILKIKIDKQNNSLICVIEDNGVGRKEAAELKSKSSTHKSFGMQITKNRIEAVNKLYNINASVEIEDLFSDNKASGTRVRLSIPILHAQNL